MLHAEIERRVVLAVVREKIQEIPLGHQGDELTRSGDVAEIADLEGIVSEDAAGGGKLLVGELQEVLEQTQFREDRERGGMHGVAAEIAEEIVVLFEDRDRDALAGEEVTEH